jgi:hypothetical protein
MFDDSREGEERGKGRRSEVLGARQLYTDRVAK